MDYIFLISQKQIIKNNYCQEKYNDDIFKFFNFFLVLFKKYKNNQKNNLKYHRIHKYLENNLKIKHFLFNIILYKIIIILFSFSNFFFISLFSQFNSSQIFDILIV